MIDSVYSQIKVLLIFSLSGIAIGTVFDIFRIQRKIVKTHDIITYIQDALFWIISSVILIITIVQYTDGEIRSYMILGLFIGIFVYFLLISKLFIKIALYIAKIIKKIVSKILYPFKKIYKIIKKD